jgi:hypothetical protein
VSLGWLEMALGPPHSPFYILPLPTAWLWLALSRPRTFKVQGSKFKVQGSGFTISIPNTTRLPRRSRVFWGHPGTTLVPSYTHRSFHKPRFQSAKLIQITFRRRRQGVLPKPSAHLAAGSIPLAKCAAWAGGGKLPDSCDHPE